MSVNLNPEAMHPARALTLALLSPPLAFLAAVCGHNLVSCARADFVFWTVLSVLALPILYPAIAIAVWLLSSVALNFWLTSKRRTALTAKIATASLVFFLAGLVLGYFTAGPSDCTLDVVR